MNRLIPLIFTFSIIFSDLFGQADTLFIESHPAYVFNYHNDFKKILDSTQDNTSNLSYDKLLIRFLNNDSSMTNYETLALMIGFTENSHYKPLEDMEKETEIFEHNKSREYDDAIQKARIYLAEHPLSLLVLREASFAYQKKSKQLANNFIMDTALVYQDSGKYFMALNDRVMEAMIYSGKGRTPEDPIFSLGLADGEYFIPNVGFTIENDGVKEKKDTEWNKKGDFLEVITALVDNVTARKYYFVIQHAKDKIDDDKANESSSKKSKKKKKEAPKSDKTDKKEKKSSKEKQTSKKSTEDNQPSITPETTTTTPAVSVPSDTIPASLKP
jgi:hypothetical protein